jgi:predicted MFS family arabinose efflux permease
VGFFLSLPTAQAVIEALSPSDKLGQVTGIVETSWSLSFLLVIPLLGALIGQFGVRAAPITIAILIIPSVFGFLFVIPTVSQPSVSVKHALKDSVAVAFRFPTLWLLCPVALLANISSTIIYTVYGQWFEKFGVNVEEVGATSIALGLGEMVGSILAATFADRLGLNRYF